ncbi:MAG TPA: hypothetical protein PKV33_00695 [Methanothrix sp.]|nr:hypothetical protein [Methanothrix sp.]
MNHSPLASPACLSAFPHSSSRYSPMSTPGPILLKPAGRVSPWGRSQPDLNQVVE